MADTNLTYSPSISCSTGHFITIDTDSPYCALSGANERMEACCSQFSNATSPVHFQPDCYSWCNVNLPPGEGVEPTNQTLHDFTACLQQGQDPTYIPLQCSGTKTTSTTSLPSTIATSTPAPTASMNMTDSSTYSCKSGGIPMVDTTGPYCIVEGGAKRMNTCCGTQPVHFYPDCYSWCHTDLPPYIGGLNPSVQVLQRFSRCLEEGQDPRYSPQMLCLNGTEAGTSTSSTTALPVSPTSSLPTSTLPTRTQSAAPTPSMPGAGTKISGNDMKIMVGLVAMSVAVEALV